MWYYCDIFGVLNVFLCLSENVLDVFVDICRGVLGFWELVFWWVWGEEFIKIEVVEVNKDWLDFIGFFLFVLEFL